MGAWSVSTRGKWIHDNSYTLSPPNQDRCSIFEFNSWLWPASMSNSITITPLVMLMSTNSYVGSWEFRRSLHLHYFLCLIISESFPHFTHIKKMCISEREKITLSVIVKYQCIPLYYKCKIEYIELWVVKVVLIRVIIEK